KRVLLRDKTFRPYFYAILSPEANPQDIINKIKKLSKPRSPIINVELLKKKYYGRPVNVLKITTVIPEYVREYRGLVKKINGVKDVVEADIRFSMRYLIDHNLHPCQWHVAEVKKVAKKPGYRVDEEYEIVGNMKPLEEASPISDLRILAFDIEVYNPKGTPRPEIDPVIIISVMNDKGELKLFHAEDKSDRDVITKFIEYIKRYDPDIITGYNSNHFDWPYLRERCKYLGIKLDVGRRIGGEPNTSTYGHISIHGRLNVDLYDFAEEIPEVKVKTLENVAEYLGVMKKDERTIIEWTEMPRYWDDLKLRPIFLKYAADDVKATYGLSEKFLPFAMQLSSITGLPLDQVGAASVGFRLEWYLMRAAYEYNELVPNRIERPYESYKGAVVLKPKRGVHENIAVLDFSSMYPNIMIKYNVGPDTYEQGLCSEETHWKAPEVGHCFKKEPPGFFKRVLSTLLELRKKVREEMKKYDPGSYEYRILNERQKALKILANATYGYMGWVGARWYCRQCAEAVTAWGRQTILKAIEFAKKLGLEVIYGDTDSLFVTYDKEKVSELIDKIEKELGFEIKIDKIYKRVFFTEAKKRYAGLFIDGRIDIVGFEAVRGDWAEIAKEVQEEITRILLKEMSIDKAIEYVRSIVSKLKEGKIPLSKLVIWKTLTKDISQYTAEAPHVVAASKMIKRGIKVRSGDKIGYVITKGVGNISKRAEPYMFVKPRDIDVNYYVDRQIIPAALRILSYFGVSEQQLKVTASGQKSLFDFFGGKK
ncbi:MAG: DNA polymerase II, partial [Candidatus Aenigmatarchaeota archaeon]